MNTHNRQSSFSTVAATDPKSKIRLAKYYVSSRSSSSIVLGLYAAEKTSIGVQSIEINNPSILIEVGQTLLITPGRIVSKKWVSVMIAEAVEIETYIGNISPKIDGIDSATCKNLARCFGENFAQVVADDPLILERFRYSAEKKNIIAVACEREADAASRVEQTQERILKALLWAGEGKTKARSLLGYFDLPRPARKREEVSPGAITPVSPYCLLFKGKQSFKTADRFASKLEPIAAERDRPLAIVHAALRSLAEDMHPKTGTGHTLATVTEIEDRAWFNFALTPAVTQAAIETLKARHIVTAIDEPKSANFEAEQQFLGRPPPQAFIGLTTLVEAEKRIARFTETASDASTPGLLKIVEYTIANAAKLQGCLVLNGGAAVGG